MYNTVESRKKAFIALYRSNLDVVQVANMLGIEVSGVFDDKSKVRGAIAFIDNKFSILYNTFHATHILDRLRIIAHEMAHWIFDYDQIKLEPLFYEIDTPRSDLEVRASQFADALIDGDIKTMGKL